MLNVKGAVGGMGRSIQSIQGMSKGPAESGPSPSGKGVMKQGVKAKNSIKMPKSKKKKVIVNSLLAMMNKGTTINRPKINTRMNAYGTTATD